MFLPDPKKKPQELIKNLTNLNRRQFLGRGLKGVAGSVASSSGLPVGSEIITGALSGKGGLPQDLIRKYIISLGEQFAETDAFLYDVYKPIGETKVPQKILNMLTSEGKPKPPSMLKAERKELNRIELRNKFKGSPTKTFEHSAEEYGRQIKEAMNLDETGWAKLESKLDDVVFRIEDNEIDRLREYQRVLQSSRDPSSTTPSEAPRKPVPEQRRVEKSKPTTQPSPRLTRTASPPPQFPSGKDLSRIALRGAANLAGWPMYAASFGIPSARSGESQVLAELADQPDADFETALKEYRQRLAQQEETLKLRRQQENLGPLGMS
tara:strand:+ start:64 stop:1032 length:969 start_codon:yes stop_codon:yes gene_type:complete